MSCSNMQQIFVNFRSRWHLHISYCIGWEFSLKLTMLEQISSKKAISAEKQEAHRSRSCGFSWGGQRWAENGRRGRVASQLL